MSFHYRYRKQIIIGVLVFLIISGILSFSIVKFLNRKNDNSDIVTKTKKSTKLRKEKKTNETLKEVRVDIKGQINNPGIYTLKEDSRVVDVIEMAGGLTENANTSVINLSKKIIDEMVIIVYSNEEVLDFKNTKEMEKAVQDKCIQKEDNSVKNDACINSSNSDSKEISNEKISINTASLEELMTLPGIGEAKAKDIISYREANGGFGSIEDITKVSGIGDNIFAQIKEIITT